MAIIDQSALSFSNNRMRPIADHFMQLYFDCLSAQADFTSKNLAALIPNDTTFVSDGAPADGRTQITGGDINVLLAHIGTFVTEMQATSNLKLNQINKAAVNPIR